MAFTRFGFNPTHTMIAGLIAGIVFAVFEMLMAALLMGADAFFVPLRMIGAMVLGAEALQPGYSLVTAGLTGMIVHLVLSIAFAYLFAALAPATATSGALVGGAIAFGTAIWIVNFYLIAPFAGWDWFPNQTNPLVQFVAHAFFYGAPLGGYLARSRTATAVVR